MAEFTELHKSLARLRGQVHVNTVVDLFAENNTTYVVDEYVSSVRFVDYLKDNAGELTWGQLSRMLPPLLTTLSRCTIPAVVHRAISPDTIYVTDKGDLLLTAFSIAAVRTWQTLSWNARSTTATLHQNSTLSANGREPGLMSMEFAL